MILGFSITSALAIYFVIWWIVLFTILPFGVRTQEEDGAVTLGTTSSAPSNPMLWRKAAVTTIVAAIVFSTFAAIVGSGYSIHDIPIPAFDS